MLGMQLEVAGSADGTACFGKVFSLPRWHVGDTFTVVT